MYQAYRSYGAAVSTECIEHLRLKHRLRVVRQLEDSLERNTLRALLHDDLLDHAELQVGTSTSGLFTCCCLALDLFVKYDAAFTIVLEQDSNISLSRSVIFLNEG